MTLGNRLVFRIVFKKRRRCRTNAHLPLKALSVKIRGVPTYLLSGSQEVAGSNPARSTN